MKLESLNQSHSSNPTLAQISTLLRKKGNTQMLKTLVISLITLISGFVLASQPLSDTALKALEAENAFIDSYNVNTTHGFAEAKDIATLALEAQAQFLNDYVINSTHGFSAAPSFPEAAAQVELLKIALFNDDLVACANTMAQLPIETCLGFFRETQFINDYVTGKLR